ncbi:MAG: SRPBCC domain-containing protein, partial [Mycobacterium sp.]
LERDRGQHRAVISGKGKESRGAGNAAATVTTQLHGVGERTRVTVDTDLKIVGKLAQFGSGALQQVSEKLLGQFVESLEAKLAATAPADEHEKATTATTSEPAPIDLIELAGAGRLKKYTPVLLGALTLLVLVLVLRRGRRTR